MTILPQGGAPYSNLTRHYVTSLYRGHHLRLVKTENQLFSNECPLAAYFENFWLSTLLSLMLLRLRHKYLSGIKWVFLVIWNPPAINVLSFGISGICQLFPALQAKTSCFGGIFRATIAFSRPLFTVWWVIWCWNCHFKKLFFKWIFSSRHKCCLWNWITLIIGQ